MKRSKPIYVGVSGWSYDDWRGGRFYPERLRRRDELEFVTRRFASVEINASFYSLLRPSTYCRYHACSPDGFVYAVKGSRFITHSKKLNDVATPLANFFASGVLRLEEKLGPLLWQLPDTFIAPQRLEAFLRRLPDSMHAASKLARKHDRRVSGRASMAVHRDRSVRHVLEVRHRDSLTDELVQCCRELAIPLVFSHSGGSWPYIEELTGDLVYLRLHGSPRTYASAYRRDKLEAWSARIRSWNNGRQPRGSVRISRHRSPRADQRTVYAYFDNDQRANAPRNALTLMELLRLEPGPFS